VLRTLRSWTPVASLCLALVGLPLPAAARAAPGPPPEIAEAVRLGAFWEIVPQLRSPDRRTVFHATWALVEIGDETCVGALAAGPGPALEGDRETITAQMRAASEILRLRLAGGAEALEGLAAMLEGRDPVVVGHAAQAMVALHLPGTVERLRGAYERLRDAFDRSRYEVGFALAATRDPAALDAIDDLLTASRRIEDGLGDARVTMLEEAYWEITTRDLDAEGRLAAYLDGLRNDNDHNARYMLVLAGAAATPGLLQVLEDVNATEAARLHAAWALGSIKDPQAIEPLARVLADGAAPESVRGRCALSLGHTGGRAAVEVLIAALAAPGADAMLLSSVIGGLELAADPIAEDALIAALEHADAVVRWSAAGALAHVGTGQYVEPMRARFAKETDRMARSGMGEVLAYSSKYWTTQDALASVTFDWPSVRIAAARFLAKLPPEPAHIDALAAQIRVEADPGALKAEAQALLDLREAASAAELEGLVGGSPVADVERVLSEALHEHQIRTVPR